jgi:hypothetical protein
LLRGTANLEFVDFAVGLLYLKGGVGILQLNVFEILSHFSRGNEDVSDV